MTRASGNPLTPAQRRERARIASGTRWSQPGARAKQAEAARAALYARLRAQVDPDGVMRPDEQTAAVEAALSAQAARLRYAKSRKDGAQ